jgi:signal transduction histidine kinase
MSSKPCAGWAFVYGWNSRLSLMAQVKTAQVKTWWQQVRRNWRSIGSRLAQTMLALVVFTTLVVFVVLGYSWALYLERVQQHSHELLVAKFNIPSDQVAQLLQQAARQAEQSADLLPDVQQLFSFSLLLLTVVPSLLAWWAARRLAGPLTQLSQAAQRLTGGDFAARVVLSQRLKRREDETAQLLQDFNAMAAALERLEHERRYGLAAIAHELRTPVTVLRGRLEGVRDGVLAADRLEFEKLIGHADGLSKLIEDLQLLSLAEAGALPLERQTVVVSSLLQQLHSDYLAQARQQQIELQLQLPLQLPPTTVSINGDWRRLYQVLGNALNNALRHTPAGGHILLQLALQNQTLTIEISDSGPGFSKEAMQRAFERFYRSPDRARQRGGSGLGLAIAKSLVEAHNGSIELVGVPTGACVRITLPLAR